MADAAVAFLLENVTQLLIREVGLVLGISSEIRLLKVELALIQQFLRDSKGKRELVKEVVDEIRSIAHEAEDIIDTFVVDVAMHKRRNMLYRYIHKLSHTFMLRSVASKIKIIKNEISAIYASTDKYGIVMNNSYENDEIARRESLKARRMQVEEDKVVSFKKDAKIVMDMLDTYHSYLDVVSIVGMGGLGKTTLAKKIYNDPSVKSRFPCRAWANVSEEFRPRDVFLHILEIVGTSLSGIPEMSDENLANELRSCLLDKKYLIVLDDVWKPEVWSRLKGAFPDTENGSRILITSRIKEVASHASSTPPYLLPLLNKDDSWELLLKKAFRGAVCPPTLESNGRKIAEKCKGLPLALVVVGGLLATREQSTLVWSQMVDNMSWYLEKNPESFNDILALSYEELPAHLKPCFLYLGVYPEDYELSARQLIRLWIAEGLVQQDSVRTPEDIADEYLQELTDRSLIMVAKRRNDRGIKSCCIHDLLRDLCITEGARDNFFIVHDGIRFIKSSNDRPRRISLLCNTSRYASCSVHSDSSLARTLLCFGDNEDEFPHFVFKDLRLTRVLDFWKQFPEERYKLSPKFEKLVLLRYLRLGCMKEYRLPPFIYNLPNLQTLDLRGSSVSHFTKHFWYMQQLRHVFTNEFTLVYDSSSHFKTMPNLQTLAGVRSKLLYEVECEIAFPNLRKLEVYAYPPSFYKIPASSKPSFGNIQNLKIHNVGDTCDLLSHGGTLSPRLTKLTLEKTSLSDAEFSSLLLPNLEILKLRKDSIDMSTGQLTNKSFRKLEVLHMVQLDVNRWWVDEERLSNFKFLVITYCRYLPMAPKMLKDETTPRYVKVENCSLALENSFRALDLGEKTRLEFVDNSWKI